MPYLTSIERLALEEGEKKGKIEGKIEGLLEGIETGLKERFPTAEPTLMPQIRTLHDIDKLRAIHKRLWTASSLNEIRDLINS